MPLTVDGNRSVLRGLKNASHQNFAGRRRLLAFGVTAAPMAALAQNYYGYGYSQNYGTGAYGPSYNYGRGYQPSYDPCSRERQGRTGAGAVIGGGAGAVIGSQLAARGRRTEGSILGGVLGAVVGSQVGCSSSDACRSYQSGYGSSGYYNQGYSQPTYGYYDNRYTGDQGYRYDDYDRRADYAYDRGGYYDDRSRPVDSIRIQTDAVWPKARSVCPMVARTLATSAPAQTSTAVIASSINFPAPCRSTT